MITIHDYIRKRLVKKVFFQKKLVYACLLIKFWLVKQGVKSRNESFIHRVNEHSFQRKKTDRKNSVCQQYFTNGFKGWVPNFSSRCNKIPAQALLSSNAW